MFWLRVARLSNPCFLIPICQTQGMGLGSSWFGLTGSTVTVEVASPHWQEQQQALPTLHRPPVAKKPRNQHQLLPTESEGRRSSEGTRAGGVSRFSEEKDEKEVLGKSEKGVTCLQWGPACASLRSASDQLAKSFLLVS